MERVFISIVISILIWAPFFIFCVYFLNALSKGEFLKWWFKKESNEKK